MHPDLTLVVHRAAAVEVAVANLGLEGRGLPFIQRVDGLHVVVSIDQRGRKRGVDHALGIDGGMARGLHQLGSLKANLERLGDQVFRVAAHVGRMSGVGRDAGDPEELDELVHVALLIGRAVGVQVRI